MSASEEAREKARALTHSFEAFLAEHRDEIDALQFFYSQPYAKRLRYRDITAYVLVANMLARRIYAQYQSRTEKAMAESVTPPNPLVITIEEAHKFLNPEVSSQTIFGTIAREMRKYNVSLLVIDSVPAASIPR